MKNVVISEAFANIALIKYWGKEQRSGNYPAVPSLSLTLSGLRTTTQISLDPNLAEDDVRLDDAPALGRSRERIVTILDTFRRLSNSQAFVSVDSHNDFPTAAGLASSASGFAALACAANEAFDAGLSTAELSSIARSASASAARSLYGGFACLEAGADSAESLAGPEHWDLVLLVAITASGKKPIGSTEAMNLTRLTSPYYESWVSFAPTLYARAKAAVMAKDLTALGEAMEQSTLMMHATMHAAHPAILYQSPATIATIHEVRRLRQEGTPCYFTMDAGPHVKVLCATPHAELVMQRLSRTEGVLDVLRASPGTAARVIEST